MPSIPVRRLGSPEGTELRLADRLVDCCGCGGQFGSAVCAAAPPIAHIFRDKQEPGAELASDPFRAVKRACLECGHPIANWHNGRRVSKQPNFCGLRCQQKAAKNVGGLSGPFCASKQQKSPHFY
jgi:hypothetical protein